jgi:mxaJ protein
MFSHFRYLAFFLLAVHCECAAQEVRGETNSPRIFRVAADPNNLPFSNDRLEGFENKIAALIAHELKAELKYVWRAQRRGFFRETLKSGDCDLVMGVPIGFEKALTTLPYYRANYSFVSRRKDNLKFDFLEDPRLRCLRIGVQLIGDDGANTPPAHALAALGIVTNVVGYTVYGDYRQPNPPARIVEAVAHGDVDVAIVWGPLAGYFARRQAVELSVLPLKEQTSSDLPMSFEIAIGVRKKNSDFQEKLNAIIERKRSVINTILQQYGIRGFD